jgi:predicted lipoprotein with Yx(FWY)xxD motif
MQPHTRRPFDIERRRTMNSKLPLALIVSALVAGTMAGCSAPSAPTSSPAATQGPKTGTVSAAASTASTALGTVIVTGDDRTAYFFDHDTANSGKSACTGGCSSTWPAITSPTKAPTVTGITGTIGTIPDGSGKFQVTVNGMPLYTYSGDSAAGDTNGQAIGGIWWVVGADGKEIKAGGTGGGYQR